MTWSSTRLFVFSKLSWCYQSIKLWFYVLIRNQATDHMAVLSQYTELDSKLTHFWKLLPVCVAQLQHCAILRPFFLILSSGSIYTEEYDQNAETDNIFTHKCFKSSRWGPHMTVCRCNEHKLWLQPGLSFSSVCNDSTAEAEYVAHSTI